MKEINIPAWQQRTMLLCGHDQVTRLQEAHVLVVGLGGVGACAAEMLCRAGIGALTIVDGDVIEDSNRNRQLPALVSTVGKSKAELMAERLLDINPAARITARHEFLCDAATGRLLETHFDYVVDAIDALSPKVHLLAKSLERGLPVVSSMGSGGKLDPGQVRISDIEHTYNCPLAKVIRKRLHRRGIRGGIVAVFSPEEVPPHAVIAQEHQETGKAGSVVGTISYMPAVFGCFCASAVIRHLTGKSGLK